MLTLRALVDKFGSTTFVSSAARFVEWPPDVVPVQSMSSRIFIPFLCAGAVIYACGPRSSHEAAALKKDSVATPSRVASVALQGEPAVTRTPPREVAADLYVRTSGNAISFSLQVVNHTRKGVELTFPTGQTHDFVVLDSAGREMWRWAEGRMFTQTLRNKSLSRGEAFEVAARMSRAPLAPGRYVARATLTSQNYPLVREAEFTVHRSTVALR